MISLLVEAWETVRQYTWDSDQWFMDTPIGGSDGKDQVCSESAGKLREDGEVDKRRDTQCLKVVL